MTATTPTREIAIGIHRTYLDNGYWVNSVLVPHNAPGGRYHTVIYPQAALCAPVTDLRSETPEGWPSDHEAAVAWATSRPRHTTGRQAA